MHSQLRLMIPGDLTTVTQQPHLIHLINSGGIMESLLMITPDYLQQPGLSSPQYLE